MDPTHAATAIVASPAWDLAVATSVVAVASEVAAASAVAVEAAEVAAVVADECCESKYEITGARV
jgi:hypothetical protein